MPVTVACLAEYPVLSSAGDLVPCDGNAVVISFHSGQCGGGKAGGIDTGSHIASCIGFSVRCDTADGVNVLGASLGSRISVGQGSGVTYTPPVTVAGFAEYTVLSSAGDLVPCDGDATVIGLHCGQLGSSRVGDGQASIIVAAGIDLAVRCDTADCIDVLGADLGSRIGERQGSGVTYPLPVTVACLAEDTVLSSAGDLVPCDGNAAIGSGHTLQCGGCQLFCGCCACVGGLGDCRRLGGHSRHHERTQQQSGEQQREDSGFLLFHFDHPFPL